jgi:hypothetical protein
MKGVFIASALAAALLPVGSTTAASGSAQPDCRKLVTNAEASRIFGLSTHILIGESIASCAVYPKKGAFIAIYEVHPGDAQQLGLQLAQFKKPPCSLRALAGGFYQAKCKETAQPATIHWVFAERDNWALAVRDEYYSKTTFAQLTALARIAVKRL